MYFVTNKSVILSVFCSIKVPSGFGCSFIYFIVPILDSGSVFFSQSLAQKSPFLPDNSHIHHMVLHFTKNHVMASLLIVANLTATLMLFSQLAVFSYPRSHNNCFFAIPIHLVCRALFIRRRVRKERFR